MVLFSRLTALRQSFGRSMVTVAQKLGVSKQTVSNWENGNVQPSVEMLIALAEMFDVSTDYLLGLESSRSINVDGLPDDFVAHLTMVMDDYRTAQSLASQDTSSIDVSNADGEIKSTHQIVRRCFTG